MTTLYRIVDANGVEMMPFGTSRQADRWFDQHPFHREGQTVCEEEVDDGDDLALFYRIEVSEK